MKSCWYHMFDRYTEVIFRRKGHLLIFFSSHRQDLTWMTHWWSSHNVRLALLFPMKWWSKRWFCFVQIDQTSQPWHKRRRFPPCGPNHVKSNISPTYNLTTGYNDQYSENKLFSTSGGQLRPIYEVIHVTRWSTQWNEVMHWVRKDPNVGRIRQLNIKK